MTPPVSRTPISPKAPAAPQPRPLAMDNEHGTVVQWSAGVPAATDPHGALHADKVGIRNVLVTASTEQPTWGAAMIMDSLKSRGHNVTYVRTDQLGTEAGQQAIAGAQSIVVRTGAHLTDADMSVLRAAEEQGKVVFNRPDALATIRTKRVTADLAKAAGARHPESTFVAKGQESDGIKAALATFDNGNVPVVIKPTNDMGGKGVVFLERGWSEVSARSIADALLSGPGRNELQIQRWMQEGTGSDTRVYFAKTDKGIYTAPDALVRISEPGKGQANISSGGRAVGGDIDDAMRAEAVRLAERTGLDFGSIDFVYDRPGGPGTPRVATMIEINSAAGLGIEENALIKSPMHDVIADQVIQRTPSAGPTAS